MPMAQTGPMHRLTGSMAVAVGDEVPDHGRHGRPDPGAPRNDSTRDERALRDR